MTKTKFGFKTFMLTRHPIVHPPRSFNKARDLKPTTTGLWCYLTTSGLVATRRTKQTANVLFLNYEPNNRAYIHVSGADRFVSVPLELIHTEERPTPVETAA